MNYNNKKEEKIMKTRIFITILFTVQFNLISQSLWDINKPDYLDYQLVDEDTSVTHLKSIILNDQSPPFKYSSASLFLAYYHNQTERDFLVNNLKTISDSSDKSPSSDLWAKYFTDQEILGFLGIQSAIAGMDTVAKYHPYRVDQLSAIIYLSKIGQFSTEYFNELKHEYIYGNFSLASSGLYYYGKEPEYEQEVKVIIINRLNNLSKHSDYISEIYNLSRLDREMAINLLDSKFRENQGYDRYRYFIELYKFDYLGQPERSIWAITQESDEFLRFNYFPNFKGIKTRTNSQVFLTPRFINFTKDWLNNYETEQGVRVHLSWFLRDFKPIHSDMSLSITFLFDSLVLLIDTIYSYTWLGDLDFSNELKNILITAKTNLQNGDSLACRVQVKAFQDLVDNVYKDSLNADPRFVTIEGWKFLYWNAQYILDRLPEPPVVVTLNLEVINPAMSLVNPGAFTMEVKGSGFSSSSVVYFNGNARATTFVSDSTLNAQVLSTDVSVAGNYPVWVTEGTTNSDTLTYRVVSTLPQPVRPVLECVRNNGDGTYTAHFGYKNDNDVSVYIPIGNRNKFTPNPQDRGQTRVFQPGRQIKVYTLNFNGSNLVWTLNGRTSTASSNSAPCQ